MHACVSNDRRYKRGRWYIECGIVCGNSLQRVWCTISLKQFQRRPLFDLDVLSRNRISIDGRAWCGNIEWDAVRACKHGVGERPDLVCDVAISGNAIGTYNAHVDHTGAH